jgi:hypothetical protein
MTRSKLSGPEKQEIAALFAQQQENIASLAERYQVSASTIRRLLKNLPTPSAPKPECESAEPEAAVSGSAVSKPDVSPPLASKPKPIPRSSKNAESATPESVDSPSFVLDEPVSRNKILWSSQGLERKDLERKDIDNGLPEQEASGRRPVRRIELPKKVSDSAVDAERLDQPLEEASEFLGIAPSSGGKVIRMDRLPTSVNGAGSEEELSEILQEIGLQEIGRISPQTFATDALEADDDDDVDDFDDLDDASEDDLEDFGGLGLASEMHLKAEALMAVMPFAEAILPKTCYLVIDRTAELVTRPLKDFGELGQIPEDEVQSQTLPIFDNHRIARRFSHRNQRIIKVPDADMLKKTCAQLSAKGITRLLVNGHIYSL